MPNLQKETMPQLRPCLVNGRRALFHCWSILARAVPPKGMNEEETDERFQYTTTRALVEFEDGTIGRPWPSEIRFVDNVFSGYTWNEPEEPKNETPQLPQEATAEGEKTCRTCANYGENMAFCAEDGYDCKECTTWGCPCSLCIDCSRWERRAEE